MFRVRSQEEWEELVRRGLRGEAWALEVAAETALDAVTDIEGLSEEGRKFLSHLIWLAVNCESFVSWITEPSCEEVRARFLRLGLEPRRMNLPLGDSLLLRRIFNSVPALWAEDA